MPHTLPSVAYITNAGINSGVGQRALKVKEALQELEVPLIEFNIDGNQGVVRRGDTTMFPLYHLPGPLGAKTITWIRLGRKVRYFLTTVSHHQLWHATNQTLSFVLERAVPAVVTVHDIIELLEPQTPLSGLAARYLYSGIRRARHIITVSKYTSSTLQQYYGISAAKISVIPNGVGEEFHVIPDFKQTVGYLTLQQELKIRASNLVVLYVGSDHPRKNVVTAVRAFAQVAAHRPELVFLKVGEPGVASGRAALLQEIDRLGIQEKVRFVGQVTSAKLNELYNLAAMLLYPSRFEGFGLPPLEALAAGTPVLTANTTALPEVVGRAALLRSPSDTAGFAHDIEQLLAQPALARELRTRGLARARQFSWKAAAQQELDVYRQVVDEG
ncbi:MAG: glycosyltransferase family 1 protein [Candidatus Andersenbacteria bacterium]